MKVTTATRRSFKTVQCSLFKVLRYVLTCFLSEKGTTSVDLFVDGKLDSDSSPSIYSSGSGIDGGAWVCALAPSLGAFSVAAELPVLDGTREVFIENPSMFQIHDDFQNRQVLLFHNFSLELLPNSPATRRRHVVVLAFTHRFDKQF